MKPVRTTPPATDLVSLEEIRKHVRRDDTTEEDGLLQSYVNAAVDHLDGYSGILGRCLLEQIWAVPFHDWLARMRLPFPDVSAATITYVDKLGTEQMVAADLYEIAEDHRGAYIHFADAFAKPSLEGDADFPITIAITTGYGAAADVPEAIKVAVMLLAAHFYENREATLVGVSASSLPLGVSALIKPFRRVAF